MKGTSCTGSSEDEEDDVEEEEEELEEGCGFLCPPQAVSSMTPSKGKMMRAGLFIV
jgi:hypothetical protein